MRPSCWGQLDFAVRTSTTLLSRTSSIFAAGFQDGGRHLQDIRAQGFPGSGSIASPPMPLRADAHVPPPYGVTAVSPR